MDALHVLELAQDDLEEQREGLGRRHLRVFRDRTNPLEEYNNVEFVRRFRISKASFRDLLNLIMDNIVRPTRRNRPVLPIEQLCIALRFYACGSFQVVVGDMCGVSQGACCTIIHSVTTAICERKDQFINFPQTQADIMAVMQGFFNIAGFPGVIGTIDGTHVPIVNPGGDNAQRFMNRKGFNSINCQFVCDHRMLFTNVVSRWYGSAHDSRIFEESNICGRFRRGEVSGILLGDPAYTCTSYMLTPIRQPTTDAETHYNRSQRRTRGIIERAFGIWKRRFLCVGSGNRLRCSLDHNMAIIVATACLHNLAKRRNDPLPDDEVAGRYEDLPQQDNRVEVDMRGNIFRERFIRQHFE